MSEFSSIIQMPALASDDEQVLVQPASDHRQSPPPQEPLPQEPPPSPPPRTEPVCGVIVRLFLYAVMVILLTLNAYDNLRADQVVCDSPATFFISGVSTTVTSTCNGYSYQQLFLSRQLAPLVGVCSLDATQCLATAYALGDQVQGVFLCRPVQRGSRLNRRSEDFGDDKRACSFADESHRIPIPQDRMAGGVLQLT